jgi:hypothetical protein
MIVFVLSRPLLSFCALLFTFQVLFLVNFILFSFFKLLEYFDYFGNVIEIIKCIFVIFVVLGLMSTKYCISGPLDLH